MENKELNLESLESVAGGKIAKERALGTIQIGNIKHRINIRQTKSGQAAAIGYAYLGDVLKYYGKEGQWYVVYCAKGRGFIHDSHVTVVTRF